MDLKFSFGGASAGSHDHAGHSDRADHAAGGAPSGIPLPFAGAAQLASTSNVLELRVRLAGDEIVAEALSGDGVTYGRAAKSLVDRGAAPVAAATRSVLARVGAELGDPLIASVNAVVLELGDLAEPVLAELGVAVAGGGDPLDENVLGHIDAALQARTGVAEGTEIRRA